MQVAINIENANQSIINAIKAMLKTHPELKFHIEKYDEKQSLLKEIRETKEAYTRGELRAFDSVEEFREAIENGKI